MCPGDELVFTCTVDDIPEAIGVWIRNGWAVILQMNKPVPSFPDFILNITYYNATERKLNSTATNLSVPVQLNRSTIGCSSDGINYYTLIIIIAGMYNAL